VANSPVVLLSGAAQGLGLACAERLAGQGWRVHGVHRSSRGREGLIQRFGADQVHQADLTEEGAAQQVVQAVLAREGQLDGVVHAMGEFFSGAPSETGRDQIQSLWRSNMLSAADLLDGARAALRESGGAAVFFGTAGLDGLRGRETTAAYTAAKTALLVWMKSAALEEAPHGVRINMVSPGIIPHMGAAPETQDPERIARIPSGRGGKPEEVAAAVNWLLSPDASYVIGQNLEVAGGWLL